MFYFRSGFRSFIYIPQMPWQPIDMPTIAIRFNSYIAVSLLVHVAGRVDFDWHKQRRCIACISGLVFDPETHLLERWSSWNAAFQTVTMIQMQHVFSRGSRQIWIGCIASRGARSSCRHQLALLTSISIMPEQIVLNYVHKIVVKFGPRWCHSGYGLL